jgi:hypothetical protein
MGLAVSFVASCQVEKGLGFGGRTGRLGTNFSRIELWNAFVWLISSLEREAVKFAS